MFDLFFKNNYINGYFLNQMIAGDYAAYKKSSNDIVKRYAGVFGPGIKPVVDYSYNPETGKSSGIGVKPTYKTLILADTVVEKSDLRSRLLNLLYDGVEPEDTTEFEDLMEFFSNEFESTDAQGFMLPHRYRDLTRGLSVLGSRSST